MGHYKAAEKFVAGNANVNAKRRIEGEHLHVAACKGNADIVTLLLNAGARKNAIDNNIMTPLHVAACKGNA